MQNVAPHSQADGIEVPKLEDHKGLPRQIGVAIMTYTIVGVNIAKNVMQIHGVNPDSGEIVNKPTTRCPDLWLTFGATARPLFGTAR